MGHHKFKRPPLRKPIIGGLCPTCGKIRYMSRKDARQAAARLARRARAYFARECEGEYWHYASWQPEGRTAFYRDRENGKPQ